MFGKLFGKNKSDSPASQDRMAPATNPAADPNLMRVYDAYGREMYITKDVWRTSVLPDAIKKQWDNPDQLYPVLVQALTDGFVKDIGSAIQHLYEIDPNHGRAACLWGIFLMKEHRLGEAEAILKEATARLGEQGYILTNLAKVYEAQKEHDRADQTLWRALEIDPNQDNAFSWYWAKNKDRDGEDAGIESIRKVARIPNSWRAQLWLARHELAKSELASAVALYEDALAHCGRPVPIDLLMQMSGDLGKAGHLAELLALTEPHFIPDLHRLQVGNNLIKAHLDLGQLDAARAILDKMYALKRPDYQQTLSFWDTEIAKARTERLGPPDVVSIGMLAIEGPIWLAPSSEGADLFPRKDTTSALVLIIGGTAELANAPDGPKRQLADTVGRISRALPLFLAEQLELLSTARAITLVPWMTEKNGGGFVLSGSAWPDQDAIQHAKQGRSDASYVVTAHVKSAHEPWSLDVRVLRLDDGKLVGNFTSSMAPGFPGKAAPQIAKLVLESLATEHALTTIEPLPQYQLPPDQYFDDYLLRLEQLLALRCAAMDTAQSKFLNNERDIIEGNIRLCADCPNNFTTRLLLVKSLIALSRVRPEIMSEFKAKLDTLSKNKPLAGPGQKIIDAAIAQTVP